jgi:hypothetical protein
VRERVAHNQPPDDAHQPFKRHQAPKARGVAQVIDQMHQRPRAVREQADRQHQGQHPRLSQRRVTGEGDGVRGRYGQADDGAELERG